MRKDPATLNELSPCPLPTQSVIPISARGQILHLFQSLSASLFTPWTLFPYITFYSTSFETFAPIILTSAIIVADLVSDNLGL